MKFGAVIVTYNRIGELRRSLKCYTHQTRPIDRLIVVDNCSTDGTVEYLQQWEKKDEGVTKEVVYLPANMGGSGGFHHGLKKMLTYEDIDWIWVADDDAYPVLDAFEKAEAFINEHVGEMDNIAAICGGCGYDGHFSNIQRFRLKKSFFGLQDMPIPQEWFGSKDGFDIDMYSFVGTIMKRENLLKAGLPREDFFIYQDDLEHSMRMKKTGRIVCTTSIKIHHRDNSASLREVSWRDYYATRNIVILYREHLDRWSLFWRIARRRLMAVLSLKPQKLKVINAGIRDGKSDKTGLHEVYRPGWKG